ncbi:hypothetical protein [uncultured Granulicatella sp.]|uniref:hypothetical protein n=1 Tax=uncultured Granulicatella sp. TaxID=316089 RepID=UPI0028D616A4|nr:hypothetical protein [uncultured Granulicatella sp.]
MCLDSLVSHYKKNVGNIKTEEEFFKKYNPWNEKVLDESIKSFKDAITQNSKSFSWLDIDSNFKEVKANKYVRYGIPNHIRGDIENSRLFLCLINPNIAKIKNRKRGIKDFYLTAKEVNSSDESLKFLEKNIDLEKHIIDTSDDSSILFQELEKKEKDNFYYFKHYFSNICKAYLEKNNKEIKDLKLKDFIERIINSKENKQIIDLKIMSKFIANLEAYPFRSQKPDCDFVESQSNLSMFSARIIIWRIVKYLIESSIKEDEKINKPIFIFRRFNRGWEPSIKNVLKYDLNFTDSELDEILNKLHEEFFLTIQKKDYNNATSSIGRKSLYRNDKGLCTKQFDEIFQNLFN